MTLHWRIMCLSHTIAYKQEVQQKMWLLPYEIFDKEIQQNPKTTQPINIAPAWTTRT